MKPKPACTCELKLKGEPIYTDFTKGGSLVFGLKLVKCPLCEAAPELLAACKAVIDAAQTNADTCAICLCDLLKHASGCVITSAELAIRKVEKRS